MSPPFLHLKQWNSFLLPVMTNSREPDLQRGQTPRKLSSFCVSFRPRNPITCSTVAALFTSGSRWLMTISPPLCTEVNCTMIVLYRTQPRRSPMEDERVSPVKRFRVGNVTAAVWKNDNGYSVTLQKSLQGGRRMEEIPKLFVPRRHLERHEGSGTSGAIYCSRIDRRAVPLCGPYFDRLIGEWPARSQSSVNR